MTADDEWEAGKRMHLELSDAAAATYDEHYEQANFATAAYMNYELDQLRRLVDEAPDRHIAVDLGCGTGRHSFKLARAFDQVYGYDISPNMIKEANEAKARRGFGNVKFEVLDVEAHLPHLGEGRASLVSCSFGMGSFVANLESLFKTVRMLLKPSGVAAFSWYNADALVNNLDLSWTPALAARIVPGQRLLRVNFEGKEREISAVAHTAPHLAHHLEQNFTDVKLSTYPTLTALFPQELFKDARAQELCRQVDDRLKDEVNNAAAGPYIFATARKRGRFQPTEKVGYERVEEVLRLHGIKPIRHEHEPLRTMDDVQEAFPQVSADCLVKSVLFARKSGDHESPETDPLILAVVPANANVSRSKLKVELGLTKRELYMLGAVDMEQRTGFSVGAIPPFGMPPRVLVFMDKSLMSKPRLWMGSGKTTESIEMTPAELQDLNTATLADITQEDSE
jgi:prolyl-tRNA editing enzyme YbaK/EbsC (Cys-tRNA(Pro) deacylase)/ubiquinone/menaquinone biosynthesis C-methylase UbiE